MCCFWWVILHAVPNAHELGGGSVKPHLLMSANNGDSLLRPQPGELGPLNSKQNLRELWHYTPFL